MAKKPLLILQLLILLMLFDASSGDYGLDNFGINYGRTAGNLPSPAAVSQLIQSLNITRVKLYDADPQVLTAFANTNVEFIVTVENAAVAKLTDESYAASWIRQWVQPHLPQTRITCIAIGNEVLSSEDTALWDALLPAMRSVHSSLVSLKLDHLVSVTTTHAMSVLSDSYPPSAGSFRDELVAYIKPILEFHSKTKSPFLINAYPYFAYKDGGDDDDDDSLLNYVLFEPNRGVLDSNTNLKYDNMLYAQIDAVYFAIELMGHDDIAVKVSETGWPSKGDADERGATPANAAKYNGNLLARVASSEGTPARPEVPVDVHVFALFNEDLKPGPTSERNYGLFYPNMSTVYDIGLKAVVLSRGGTRTTSSSPVASPASSPYGAPASSAAAAAHARFWRWSLWMLNPVVVSLLALVSSLDLWLHADHW